MTRLRKFNHRGVGIVELTVGLVIAGVVVAAAAIAYSDFMAANSRQRNRAQAAQLLETVANDIRSNFAKRRAEAVPVPNPQVNLTALPAPELGTGSVPSPPCGSVATGPACVQLQMTRNAPGGATSNVTYQTTCNGGLVPSGASVQQLHPSLVSSSCTLSPQISVNRAGAVTTYPGKNNLEVVAMAVCFRCFDKGANTYEWVAEISAAYPGPKKTWVVLHKKLGLSTDAVSPGIEIVGP